MVVRLIDVSATLARTSIMAFNFDRPVLPATPPEPCLRRGRLVVAGVYPCTLLLVALLLPSLLLTTKPSVLKS